MNREKRAKAYANTALRPYGDVTVVGLFVSDITIIAEQAYLQGAKDADDSPAWRMCEDEMPEPDTQCWCATSDGKEIYAQFNGKYWRYSGTCKKDIVAWLPLPKFNPKQL